MRHLEHAKLVKFVYFIIKDAEIPCASLVIKARGLRSVDCSRLGDIVALVFFVEGRHLVINALVTYVYMNSILTRVASVA
jgi:hypothetical protein